MYGSRGVYTEPKKKGKIIDDGEELRVGVPNSLQQTTRDPVKSNSSGKEVWEYFKFGGFNEMIRLQTRDSVLTQTRIRVQVPVSRHPSLSSNRTDSGAPSGLSFRPRLGLHRKGTEVGVGCEKGKKKYLYIKSTVFYMTKFYMSSHQES